MLYNANCSLIQYLQSTLDRLKPGETAEGEVSFFNLQSTLDRLKRGYL